jgi:hypothetical protein
MVGSHIDKGGIGFQIVYAIWIGAGYIGRNKIMIGHCGAFSLPMPLFFPVFIGSQHLFFLGVNRDYRVFALERFFSLTALFAEIARPGQDD